MGREAEKTLVGINAVTNPGELEMSAIGDIASILEKIPIWKRLKTLPNNLTHFRRV